MKRVLIVFAWCILLPSVSFAVSQSSNLSPSRDFNDWDPTIVFIGDSLTAGSMGTKPYNEWITFPKYKGRSFDIVNKGKGGAALGLENPYDANYLMIKHMDQDLYPHFHNHSDMNIVVIWGGTNDLIIAGASLADTFYYLYQYCKHAHLMGWKVVVLTMISRINGEGTLNKLKPPDLNSDAQTILNEFYQMELIQNGILEDVSTTKMRLKVNLNRNKDKIHKIIGDIGYWQIWGALQGSRHADINGYNTLIRAFWPLFADSLADVAADPRLGTDEAYSNKVYFADDTHLNDNGYKIVAGIVKTAVLKLVEKKNFLDVLYTMGKNFINFIYGLIFLMHGYITQELFI
jgi:lysophospholipase L1-like esterase